MKTLIVYSSSSTYRPRSVVASLAVDQKFLGHDVTVLEVGAFSYVNQDLPPRWYANLFGHTVYPRALESVLEENEVAFHTLRRARGALRRELPPEIESELHDAVFSELVTYILSDKPDLSKWFPRYSEKRIREAAEPIFWSLSDYLQEHPFERALIPNGRVPDQRLALKACLARGLSVEYYEIGRAVEHSYYLGTQQVHDRDGTQAEVATMTAHLTDKETKEIANRWLETRMTTGLSIHPFNRGWKKDNAPAEQAPTGTPVAVFFSSSVDEFASYGGSWSTHTWNDQYEAFEAIMANLSLRGVRCVLRLHPNLRNKSLEYVSRELARVEQVTTRFPELLVLSHTDPTDSYELVKMASYVVVGRSTLGLEASCLGKCVWTTTAARYDSIADVRSILGPEAVTEKALTLWKVKPEGAHRFVSYWVIQDHPFRFGEDRWSSWDTLNAPLSMRIGNLFVPNSIIHKLHLIRLEIVKAINARRGRRFSHKQMPLKDR